MSFRVVRAPFLLATAALFVGGLSTPLSAQAPAVARVVRTAAVVEEPRGNAASVGTVAPGEVVEVLDVRGDWYLVRPPAATTSANWRTGWISRALIETVDPVSAGALPPAAALARRGQEQQEPSARRKGFLIGIGAGPALHRAPLFGFGGGGPTNDFAVVTDFRIGYAPTDQVLLHYSNKVAWTRNVAYDLVGFSGFGVTYMLDRTSPSAFVTGAIGAGAGGTLSGGADQTGLGFGVGGGFEFARHLSIDGEAMFVRLSGARNHTVLRAGFHYLFY